MVNIFSIESLYQFLAQSFISFYPLTENPLKRLFCGFLAALSVSIFHSWSLKELTMFISVKTFLNCPHHREFLKNCSILRIRCRSGSGGAEILKKFEKGVVNVVRNLFSNFQPNRPIFTIPMEKSAKTAF